MNSSISNSERGWRWLLRVYAAWVVVFLLLLGGCLLALDPYDTGRFAVFGDYGVPKFGQRLIAASVGRAEEFNTAIIGNSTMQLVDPGQLGGAEHKAVSLTIPGTGPREQLAVAEWFLEHHPKARALIIGIDDRWCAANAPLELTHPFPFWLYERSKLSYVLNMIQYQTIESALRKIKLMRGRAQPVDKNGYNDYDAGHNWDKAGFEERVNQPNDEAPFVPVSPPYDFPAVPMLEKFVQQMPPETSLLLVMPPQFQPSNDAAGAQRDACKKAFAATLRPQSGSIDFLSRRDLTSDEQDYLDRLHYRARVARATEKEIRKAMKGL